MYTIVDMADFQMSKDSRYQRHGLPVSLARDFEFSRYQLVLILSWTPQVTGFDPQLNFYGHKFNEVIA